MSLRAEVLLWAQRVVARRADAPAHLLLEISAEASLDDAREAFHKIARTGHPDLHRSSLTPAELETLTSAYARVAGAYQDFRSKRTPPRTPKSNETPPPSATGSSDRTPPVGAKTVPGDQPARTPTRPGDQPARSVTKPSDERATTTPGDQRVPVRTKTLPDQPVARSKTMQGTGLEGAASGSPSSSTPGTPLPMNNRALIYYRKVEMCLRNGDLKTALLNMKMAIAGDPQSAFLRTALAELESELAKK